MKETLGQLVLEVLEQRAPVLLLRNAEYRTRCLRPDHHKHGDAHPSMDFNLERGAICRVCGFKAGLSTLARELGINPAAGNKQRRLCTETEAMRALMDIRKLRPETLSHFGVEADIERQAWRYPLPSGHRRWKAFEGKNAPKKYWHQRGTPNQLYGLGELVEGTKEVFIANGEPAVWACHQAQVAAVCAIYGEGRMPEGALNALLAKGVKKIAIVPDLDEPGCRGAISTFNAFHDDPALQQLDSHDNLEFSFVQLPQELGEGADLGDLYARCGGDDGVFRQTLATLPRLSFQEFAELHDAKEVALANLEEPSITPLSPPPSVEDVENTVRRNFPESDAIWLATDATLSVCGALLLEDLSHPLGLNLQDVPSSWKTTVLEFLAVPGLTYRSDHFTPRSFVTHAANVKKQELSKIDLLPRIKNKVFIVPELAPLFGVRKEDLLDNISILVRVFDGQGLLSDSGVQGRRGYTGEHIFGWLGATTPLADSTWFLLGKLGSRWLFLSMESADLDEEKLIDMMASEESFAKKVAECRVAVSSFLADLLHRHPIKSIGWERTKDDRELLRFIARLANLVRRLRGTIASWGEEGEHTPPLIEFPPRLVMLLYDLARGHAIIHGRRLLARDDINIVAQVALSSMPDARRRIFHLLKEEGALTTKDIMELLRISRPTALKLMRTLAALGAVGIEEEQDQNNVRKPSKIYLLPDDEWLLREDFACTAAKNFTPPASVVSVVSGGGGVKESDTVHVIQEKPNHPCPACGFIDWWQREHGGWVCGTCHPNPALGIPEDDVGEL